MKTSSNISTRKLVIGSVAVVVLAAAVFFFTFFQVKTVEVIGNDHYTEAVSYTHLTLPTN